MRRIQELTEATRIAMKTPDDARASMANAVVGHRDWGSNGIREIADKLLHKEALSAVTDHLIENLTQRKRAEIKPLIEELDALRQNLVKEAGDYSFQLLDKIVEARSF